MFWYTEKVCVFQHIRLFSSILPMPVLVSKKCVGMPAYYDAWTWILNDWLWVTPYNRPKLYILWKLKCISNNEYCLTLFIVIFKTRKNFYKERGMGLQLTYSYCSNTSYIEMFLGVLNIFIVVSISGQNVFEWKRR